MAKDRESEKAKAEKKKVEKWPNVSVSAPDGRSDNV